MNNQDYEIDLRKLLYRSCMQWRRIIIGAIVVALILAAKEAFDGIRVLKDPEKLAQEEISFEREHNSWESQEVVLTSQIETLENDKARQQEYNDKSLLMDIDPLNEYYGSFSLYIDSGYKVVPGMSMQNIDYTGRILSAYSRFLTGGELYEYMLDNTNMTDEQKYLKEVVSFSVNQDSAMITVTAVGNSAEQVDELLTLVKNGISSKYDTINRTVDDHTYDIINEVAYSYVNYSLQDTQKENLDKIAEINTKMQEVNLELEKWKTQSEPRFEYSTLRILKNAIKQAIIGGIVGAAVMFCWYAAKYVFGQDFTEDKASLCMTPGTKIIGTVYTDKPEKRFSRIDSFVSKIFGERDDDKSFAESCALTGSNAAGMMRGKDRKLALIGAVESEFLNTIGEYMQASSCTCSIDIIGNILDDPKAVNSLSNYDSVAVVAEEKKNDIVQISRQFELLKAWNKDVLGSIIVK